MKYLFAAGGTAGHINPALAIAEAVKSHDPKAEITFVGTKTGMENELVTKKGYPILHLPVQGLRRSLSPANFKTLLLALAAPRRAGKILQRLRPDIVIGTGGYLSLPVAIAAHRKHIPVLLHESNAYPGLAVRMAEPYTDNILLHLDSAKKGLRHPEKAITVGNPLFSAFRENREAARRQLGLRSDDFFVLSFGGSLGAEALNRAMQEVFLALTHTPEEKNLYVRHATGKNRFSDWQKKMEENPVSPQFLALPYIDDVPHLMRAADLLITRSGAGTLSEIAFCGVPSILIPSPNVTGNHQYQNAKCFADAGAAFLLPENELTKEALLSHICTLRKDPKKRRLMGEKARSFCHPDAGNEIWKIIQKLLTKI